MAGVSPMVRMRMSIPDSWAVVVGISAGTDRRRRPSWSHQRGQHHLKSLRPLRVSMAIADEHQIPDPVTPSGVLDEEVGRHRRTSRRSSRADR